MTDKQNTTNKIKYTEDHIFCKNYKSKEDAIWSIINLNADVYYAKEEVKHPTLAFLLSGEMLISTASTVKQKVAEGQMFLIPAGDNFYVKTITNISILRCSFDRNMALCNKYTIEQLQKYVTPDMQQQKKEIVQLPIHEMLLRELETTKDAISSGLLCVHYQQIKKEVLFIELRDLYEKEQLATLFAPILGNDNDFKNRIMEIYPQIETAQELMDKFNMSPTSFKRKFQQSFGNSPRKWLIQKKKEKIFRDIVMTNISIKELANKYKFTVNYMTTFCREHFGKSPTLLRSEWNSHIKE